MNEDVENLVRGMHDLLSDSKVVDGFAALAFMSAIVINEGINDGYKEEAAEDLKQGILAALRDLKGLNKPIQ